MVGSIGPEQKPQTRGYKPSAEVLKQIEESNDSCIKKGMFTEASIVADKALNLPGYFKRGLNGNRNSNFYEFLSMGMFPYITGSLTLIALFSLANKHFASAKDSFMANKAARPLIAGVLLFGVLKEASKNLIDKPVKWMTGIELNQPYRHVAHEFPDYPGDKDLTSIEYPNALGSNKFVYKKILEQKGEKEGGTRTSYFDNVNKKAGLGEDLNSPEQAAMPKISQTITKATAVKNISSYIWAALGVALAAQPAIAKRKFTTAPGLPLWQRLKTATKLNLTIVKDAIVELYKGQNKAQGIAGKFIIASALTSTILGNILIYRGFKENKTANVNDKNYRTNINPKEEYKTL